MLDKLRLTAKNSFIYSLGNISVKITGLILIPIYTNPKYLSVADFGVLGILEISSLILISIFEMSLNLSLARWYWDSNYRDRQKSMFFTILVSILVIAIASILSLSFFSGRISVILFNNGKFGNLIWFMIIASALEVVSGTLLTLLKLQQRAGLFTITNMIKLAVNLTATVVLIVRYNKSLEAIFIGQIFGNIVFILLLGKYVIKNIKIKFEGIILKEMLNYSYPLIFAAISSNLITAFDRYSLNYLSTLDNVGIYNLGFKISNTIKILLITSIQMAVLPMLFKIMNDTGSGRFYSKYMTYFSLLTMFVVIALSLFSQEIIAVFTVNPLFGDSYKIVPILTISIFFGMLKETSMIGLQIAKKTKIISVVIFLITGLSLGLNVLLIPFFGIYGAAFSVLLTQVIFFITIYLIAQKNYFIPYEINKILIIFFIGAFLAGGCYFFSGLNFPLRIIFKTIFLLGFPAILFLFNLYEPIEIDRMEGFVSKWKNLKKLFSNFKGFIKS